MNQRDWFSTMGMDAEIDAETEAYANKLFAGLGLTREMLTGEPEKVQEPGPSRYDLIRKEMK